MKTLFVLFSLLLSFSAQARLLLYTDRPQAQAIANNFAAETGIPVQVVLVPNYAALLVRLEAEAGLKPDVIFTKDIVYLADLSKRGLFQPMTSALVENNVDQAMRDPNGLWTSVTFRARTLVYDINEDVSGINTYEDLAKSDWYQKLCLRNGTASYTQALVAYLLTVNQGDVAKTQETVNGWVNNAVAYKSDDMEIIQAIANGECQVGIVNSYYVGQAIDPNGPYNMGGLINIKLLNQENGGVHVNGTGIGIAKTSEQVAESTQLIEYFLNEKSQTFLVNAHKDFAANKAYQPALMGAVWPEKTIQSWNQFVTASLNWTQIFPNIEAAKTIITNADYQ